VKESSVRVPYGYFHGRFQPFHLGHLVIVRAALEEVSELIIGVSNPFRCTPIPETYFAENQSALGCLALARDPASNPWPMWARVLMIREGLRSSGVDLGRITTLPNLANTGLPVSEATFPKEMVRVFLCPKSDHNQAALESYRADGWDVREIRPSSDAVGASEIRRRMRQAEDWESLVPSGTAEVIRYLGKEGLAAV
jgi:nicotinamide-nucleotide adenylyltransferase